MVRVGAPAVQAGHEKRKGDSKAGAIKDRRASGGSANGAHTHPEDDAGSGETLSPTTRSVSAFCPLISRTLADDGKAGKGGKTSEKRKLQNRQAQRNFRERKEKVREPPASFLTQSDRRRC